MSNDVKAAFGQGISEANAAVAAARDLGLTSPDGSGTIIYYDMEDYNTEDTACRKAVRSFITGWNSQLHATGNLSGVYGSSCGAAIKDHAESGDVPDAVWPAAWSSTTAVSCLDNDPKNRLWIDHQRIRQYEGGHNETHGGVTMNIDSNTIDGIVADVAPSGVRSKYIGGAGATAMADFQFSIQQQPGGAVEGWLVHASKPNGTIGRLDSVSLQSLDVQGDTASVWGKARWGSTGQALPFTLVITRSSYELRIFHNDGSAGPSESAGIIGGAIRFGGG
ncbi:MAG: DUF1906 domain-containing protein [Chloroflexi bacterium]|nr:DUF1906 domain-containing protein [Chloroflexota bacterium]